MHVCDSGAVVCGTAAYGVQAFGAIVPYGVNNLWCEHIAIQ